MTGFNRFAAALLVLTGLSLVFLPGLSGPFVFDDLPNITSNYYIKTIELSVSSFYRAALSGDSGPLGRPVAMLSFALNHLWGDGFNSTFSYKLTNLIIHLLNGFLVFLLIRLLLMHQSFPAGVSQQNGFSGTHAIALTLAAFWLTHPIQVNVVHYIVQRMTSLSALFVLLGLIAYIYGRLLCDRRKHAARILLFGVLPISFVLGMFSKENAILLIPMVVLVDFHLFRNSAYWRWLFGLDRRILVSAVLIIALASILGLTLYALPGYAGREFTLSERLMSETRILNYYLGLIFFPLISKFGLFHDDIAVSTGLFRPVTTFFSIISISLVSALAFIYRARYPYLLFGWIWFLVSHSIESTFIALEITHEHRNYLALVGPLYACTGLFSQVYRRYNKIIFFVFVSLLIASVAFVSYLRSDDWRSHDNLILAESSYHPHSPRAQGALGSILVKKGHLQAGLAAMTKAYELQPTEAGYLINMILITDMMKKPVPVQWEKTLVDSFANRKITPLSMIVLKFATTCAIDNCRNIRLLIEDAAHACANRTRISRQRRAQCLYYEGTLKGNRGQFPESARLLRNSYNLDNKYLHPLFGLAVIHLMNHQYPEAKSVIEELIQANKTADFPRTRELQQLVSRYNSNVPNNGPGAILYK